MNPSDASKYLRRHLDIFLSNLENISFKSWHRHSAFLEICTLLRKSHFEPFFLPGETKLVQKSINWLYLLCHIIWFWTFLDALASLEMVMRVRGVTNFSWDIVSGHEVKRTTGPKDNMITGQQPYNLKTLKLSDSTTWKP